MGDVVNQEDSSSLASAFDLCRVVSLIVVAVEDSNDIRPFRHRPSDRNTNQASSALLVGIRSVTISGTHPITVQSLLFVISRSGRNDRIGCRLLAISCFVGIRSAWHCLTQRTEVSEIRVP